MDKIEKIKQLKNKILEKKAKVEFDIILSEMLSQLKNINTNVVEKDNSLFIEKVNSLITILEQFDINKPFENLNKNIDLMRKEVEIMRKEFKEKELFVNGGVDINGFDYLISILEEISNRDLIVEVKKPKWYKDFSFDFEFLFTGIKTYFDNFAKKIFNVFITNGKDKPIFVNVLDQKGNIITRFGGTMPLGSPTINSIQIKDEDGDVINPATEETLQKVSTEETLQQLLTTMNTLLMKFPDLMTKPNNNSLYTYMDTTTQILTIERLDFAVGTRFQLLDGPIQNQRNYMLGRGLIGF